MTPVALSESAKADIRKVALRYEMEKEGLGDAFLDRVLETVERIEANPQGYAKEIREARKVNVRKFPYSLWFKLKSDGSIVIACLHHKRDRVFAKERALGVIPSPNLSFGDTAFHLMLRRTQFHRKHLRRSIVIAATK